MMYHGFNGHGWDMGWGMGLGWFIGLLILVVGVWLIIRAIDQNRSAGSPARKTPLDILKERYAKGEIDKEEFEEKKKDLSS
jgi:putative membrane protein